MSAQEVGQMLGINEDSYWDSYQKYHDPQWRDNDDDEDDLGIWNEVDMEVDERILER